MFSINQGVLRGQCFEGAASGGGSFLLDLLPHQKEAFVEIEKAIGITKGDARTQCRMACGTGKTFVGLRAIEAFAPRISLVCLPTLALTAQTLSEYRSKGQRPDVDYVIVCSDSTVSAQDKSDNLQIDLSTLNARVTNSESELITLLKAKRSKPLVVMSTYHSLPIVSSIQQRLSSSQFELSVVDEAHKSTGRSGSVFGLVHDATQVRSQRRLYMTATARFFEGEDEVYSMDDESVFGSVCYSLPFAEAVKRKLLTDYRVLMPLIKESDSRFTGLDRNSLATYALLKAIEEHDIRKVITFHKDTKNADSCSRLLGNFKHEKHPIWTHHINGTMPTQKRTEILNQFGRQSRDHISITTNCRCLTEGIDVPSLDAVAFYDPRDSEVDIAQALGRAVRKAPGKTYGYFIIPLLVSDGQDAEGYLNSSEFKKIGQVIRALGAFDDSFAGKIRALSEGLSVSDQGQDSDLFQFSQEIDARLIAQLKTKIVKIGISATRKPLSNQSVIDAAREYFKEHGKLPTSKSKSPVPGFTDETWSALNQAGAANARNLKGSLFEILEPLRRELNVIARKEKAVLTNKQVIDAARKYYKMKKKLPNAATKDSVPGLPGETWKGIDLAGRFNYRGLTTGLADILKPLRTELGLIGLTDKKELSNQLVIKAARAFFKLNNTLPNHQTKAAVPGMPGERWKNFDAVGRRNTRGLKGSLSEILKPLREELNLLRGTEKKDLSDTRLRIAARKYYKLYTELPTAKSEEPVPGLPNETWGGLNKAGLNGKRGLSKSLASILDPLRSELKLNKAEILLSQSQVQAAARVYYMQKNKLPHATIKDPVPGLPQETWNSIDRAGRNKKRGLTAPLSQLLNPLRIEFGLPQK